MIFRILILLFFLLSCNESKNIHVKSIKAIKSGFELEGTDLNQISEAKLKVSGSETNLKVSKINDEKVILTLKKDILIKLHSLSELIIKTANAEETFNVNFILENGSVGLNLLNLSELDQRYKKKSDSDSPTISSCPNNYIKVNGDEKLGTTNFCVMKYEARSASNGVKSDYRGIPLRAIVTQLGAISFCQNQGPRYSLINNAQWMSIAVDIAKTSTNWSGGAVGNGRINRGHTDSEPLKILSAHGDDKNGCYLTGNSCDSENWHEQRRTHQLSNGEYIWDFSGNVWEWVDFRVFDGKIGDTPSWTKISKFTEEDSTSNMTVLDIRPTQNSHPFWDNSWSDAQGMGRYAPYYYKEGGAAIRGGSYVNGTYAGVFSLYMHLEPQVKDRHVGFRCVYKL